MKKDDAELVRSMTMRATLCALGILLFIIVVAAITSGCGLTRIASTEAKYFQRGDTTVQIITKTTTTIDAKTSVPITQFIK